ncbi:hypothetical protein OHA45_10750 [Streptomyces lydicus]|uniref:hypothetical protein n=1 Tax=Streptomyces lydicus TaxID=47763 RepID=UPI002E37B97E|nr:hypothetical protein [Streptomyces lydicus]
MGWTILYIAFGLVALWLLGEVLLQNKARLRWRLLAFAGFLAVVVGVVIPSVIVIGVGLVAFAVGQTNVTLSFKRGFTDGWALRTRGGESRGRRGRRGGRPAAEPSLQVSEVEAAPAGEPPADAPARPAADSGGPDTFESTGGFQRPAGFPNQDAYAAQGSYDYQADGYRPDDYTANDYTANDYPANGYPAGGGYGGQDPYQDPQDQSVFATQSFPTQSFDATTVYAPQPMPDETGQYGVYSPDARAQQDAYPGYDAYGTPAGTAPGDANGYAYDGGYGQPAAAQDPYGDPYAAYGDGRQQGYADPYTGAQQYAAPYDPYAQPEPYAQPDPYGQPDPYAQAPYDAQQYGGQGQPPGQGYGETPPGGVWVPQQRDGDLPPEQQPPYPPYQQQGYDEQQYRY